MKIKRKKRTKIMVCLSNSIKSLSRVVHNVYNKTTKKHKHKKYWLRMECLTGQADGSDGSDGLAPTSSLTDSQPACQSTFRSVCLPICQSANLPVCLPASLSLYWSVCLCQSQSLYFVATSCPTMLLTSADPSHGHISWGV
jgi:hypothetical protein